MTALLREDAVQLANGGGKVVSTLNPIRGADRVARFMAGVMRNRDTQAMSLRIEQRSINGDFGIVAWAGERIVQILSIQADGGRIVAVYILRNPDKMGTLLIQSSGY